MKRKIAGFHQDELSDWVADLECGHTQHVRHHPPFQTRPWVITDDGRRSRLGFELECRKCDEEPAHLTEGRNLVRRYYSALWNAWNVSLAEELLAPDFRFQGSVGAQTRGREAFVGYLRMIQGVFPDFHNRIDDLITEDTKVVARLTYTGTHRGRIFGIDGTGTKVSYAGVAIFTVGGDQLLSGWVLGDTYALMRQLGIIADTE